MVDSTKGVGSIQNIPSTNRPQKLEAPSRKDEVQKSGRGEDKVEISEEALTRAQAEQAASEVRASLAKNEGVTLGLHQGFDKSA